MTWNAEQEDPINKKKEDIVRCGECKFYTGIYCYHKMQYGLGVTESDYCSKGERKAMNDLISRQAAIDALDGEFNITGRENAETIRDYINGVDKKLRELPSAERRGRWIKKYRGNYLCSVCGAWYRTTDDYGNIIDGEMTANYCESCGAKMDEVETNETCTSRRSE